MFISHVNLKINKCDFFFQTTGAVIVVHDIFGYELKNTRAIADMCAQRGLLAVIPNFYEATGPWPITKVGQITFEKESP